MYFPPGGGGELPYKNDRSGRRKFSKNTLKDARISFAPGGYSSEFVVGVCRPILQILTLFQTKTCHFPYPFSDQLASKIHSRFQTWIYVYKGLNYISPLLRLERQQQIC